MAQWPLHRSVPRHCSPEHKIPATRKLVEPPIAIFALSPSTTIILLCCSLPICWRFTWSLPALITSLSSAIFSPEPAVTVRAVVVNDDAEPGFELFEPGHHFRLVEVVGNYSALSPSHPRLLCPGHPEFRPVTSKPIHASASFVFGMRRSECQALVRFAGQ
jgi:hypothetical protein